VSAQNRKYDHGEAFCVMSYKCENDCKEILWNSRDGVTPFTISCAECGGSMEHINWRDDVQVLTLGEVQRMYPAVKRIFVTATPYDKYIIKSAEEYVDKYWTKDIGYGQTMQNTMYPMNRKSAVDYFIKEWTKEGSPTVISVADFEKRRV
jgi:hypothetical protein